MNLNYSLLLFTILLTFKVFGQGSPDPLNFLENKDKIVQVPQSPEVAAFEKYGNLPINFYAGAPEISIPVFTHKGKEMSLPISLTYDATGIKVEQIATNVGLGWNLNFGGVVSREVKHFPDDLYFLHHMEGGYYGHQKIYEQSTRQLIGTIKTEGIPSIFNSYLSFNSQATANLMSELYTKYKEETIDLLPDEFNFNVNGLSGKIFINYDNNTAYCITDPNIKASFTYGYNNNNPYINKWVIIDATGTTYTFDAVELTKNHIADHDPSPWNQNTREFAREFSSAWYLTKIVSPNGFDTYEFFYSTPVYWDDKYRIKNPTHSAAAEQVMNQNTYNIIPNFPYTDKYQKRQFHLDSIKYNQSIVFSTETADRDDLISNVSGQKMKRFTRFKIHNVFGLEVQKMDLIHSYFKNQQSQTNNWENSRLKLDGVIIYNLDVTDPKKYTFDYIEPNSMPKITSNAIDFWGYYNGADGNQHLIANSLNLSTTGFNFANRNPNIYFAKRGTLNKITYPTGGTTTFHYEAHKDFGSNQFSINGIVGGLRIFKQESETLDSGDTNKITKLYYYGDATNLTNPANLPGSYSPSAVIHQPLKFNRINSYETYGDPNFPVLQIKYKIYLLSQNINMAAPNVVGYTHVSEIEYHSGNHNGFTVYEFYNDYLDIGFVEDLPFVNKKPSNGKLKIKSIYDKNKIIQSESINTYSNEEEGNVGYTGTGYGITLVENPTYLGGDKGCSLLGGNKFYIEPLTVQGYCSHNGPVQYLDKPYNYYQIISENYISYYWAKLESNIEKSYFPGNANPVVTTTSYLYNDNRLTKEVTKTLSNGETSATKVFYPKDLENTGQPDNVSLLNLVNRNSISEPIKVETYRNATKTGTQRKYYPTSGGGGPGTGPNAILPTKISAAKENLQLEDKVFFHHYDNYGNPVRISYADAPQKYYIWGYNNQLMVGQIENWPDNPPPSALSIISNLINESNDQLTTQEELLGLLVNLRTALPDAQVTGFTHKPGVGISSISDAKGDVIYYHYDQNNRLEYVKDKYGSRLSENEYNYRINN